MTTHRDHQHETRVDDIIATVSDTVIMIEMQELASQFARIRRALRLSIIEINKLDEEYGNEHIDLISDLAQILGGLRSEELSMHEMHASVFGDTADKAGA